MITPYECEYTVMLSPPSAPVVKESTGITMFIIDEMREAKEAKARLAKVIIKRRMFSKRLSSGTLLSSPRAESARAFTGRRNSHSGRGEDFLSCQPIFFTETAVTPERKVEKWFPRWEINRHAEG